MYERYWVMLMNIRYEREKERERVRTALLSLNLKMLLASSLDRGEAGKESESVKVVKMHRCA